MSFHLVVAVLLFLLESAMSWTLCNCTADTVCCVNDEVKSFMRDYKRGTEEDAENLNAMSDVAYVARDYSKERASYVRGLLFDESEAYALDSFINGLYDEVGKALDDAVTKLGDGAAPSYHRQFCTAKTVNDEIGCEFKKAAQVFVMACNQTEPSIVAMMPSSCDDSSVRELLSSCVLDEPLGTMHNFEQVFNMSDILRTRLFHLVFVYFLCDGRYLREGQVGPVETFPKAIQKSFEAAFESMEQRYWPSAAIEMAKALAEEAGPFGYPTETDKDKYYALRDQITDTLDTQWGVPLFGRKESEHVAVVYYDCDDCAMMTDDKWINAETKEQEGRKEWWAKRTPLGTAKHVGLNILLYREGGARVGKLKKSVALMEMLGKEPRKKSAVLLELLDEELSKDKGNPWRASDKGWFRALLAISCAYKFDWRELSWRYYPAVSYSAHHLDVFSGSVDSRCTRVVFID